MIKFRCSSLGSLMTEARSKSETLSETCKAHLIEVFVEHKYGRIKDVDTKYMEKGREVEQDSLTLYSRLSRTFFTKNETRLENDWITGEPDAFIGKSIHEADVIIDTKSSWDLHSFWKARLSDVNKAYYWQLQGYCMLTGARSARLVYCLINTPESLVLQEKKRLWYKLEVIDEMAHPEYQEGCRQIELNMTFDDIPIHDKCFVLEIQRDLDAFRAIQDRVVACREYMHATFWPERQLEESLNIHK